MVNILITMMEFGRTRVDIGHQVGGICWLNLVKQVTKCSSVMDYGRGGQTTS